MMLNRDKIGLWTRIGAIVLAAIFVLSGVLFGMTSNSSYNLLDLFRSNPQGQQTQPTIGSE